MIIKRHLFPVILLAVFFAVIGLGMMSGYWQTQGGGRRAHTALAVEPTPAVLVQNEIGG